MTNLPFHTMIHNGSQAPAPMGHRQEPEVGRNMSFQRGYKFHRRKITNMKASSNFMVILLLRLLFAWCLMQYSMVFP